MKIPTKKTSDGKEHKRKRVRHRKTNGKIITAKPKFGTSNLEKRFAKDFLEKLKVKYMWQFPMTEIGRFADYYLPESNLLIEIDGGYYHSDPRVVNEDKLTPMQKKNRRVDAEKDKWAAMHSIPMMRIWEKDINENPEVVMKLLKERLNIGLEKMRLKNDKKKRHINKLVNKRI